MNLKENRLIRYFYEAKEELEKVSWPSRKETLISTLIVVAVSVATAVFLGALDFGLNKALELLVTR